MAGSRSSDPAKDHEEKTVTLKCPVFLSYSDGLVEWIGFHLDLMLSSHAVYQDITHLKLRSTCRRSQWLSQAFPSVSPPSASTV